VLIRGGWVVAFDPPLVERVDLRITGDRIVARNSSLEPGADEEVLDLEGGLVLPGLVNAHSHLYSALARGMPSPSPPPRTFPDMLGRVWWRLDRALDEEAIRLSALVGAIEAALSGTTFIVDHHSSPACVGGSLSTIRAAVEEIGLRSCLCYEVSDRNGPEAAAAGIEENAAFAAQGPTALTRGMFGAHASFTLSDETLDRVSDAIHDAGSSLHIHAGEDRCDVDDCRARWGLGIVERLKQHRLLLPRTLLAHGVHLTSDEVEEAHRNGAWLLHNARSNMNNAVGYAPTASFKRAALGTDGIDQDMFCEARSAYLRMRDAGRKEAMNATMDQLAGGHRLAAALAGLPFGKVAPGAPADLVVLDYRPPTPMYTANLASHLLFGLDRSHVRCVMVAGRFIVRDRRIVTVDVEEVYRRARGTAKALWWRMQNLDDGAPGTSVEENGRNGRRGKRRG
jgi:putative selenium metabolism protein SsnA